MKLYELDINGDTSEVYFNSIVSIPAHMKVAMKFNEADAPVRFSFNDEKQIITGVMVAVDEPIYRYNPETKEEFNVIFRKATADKLLLNYMKKGYANNLNLEHNEGQVFNSATLIGMYQVDSTIGMSVPKAFEGQNLQDGSIIVSYKIEDAKEWEQAKTRAGFSIEGIFDMVEVTNNKSNMSLMDKLGFGKTPELTAKEAFEAKAEKFAEATLEDGTVIMYDGELAEGTEVFIDVDGVLTAPENKVHALGGEMEGVLIETVDGVITAVTMPEEQAADEKEEEEEEEKLSKEEVAEAMSALKADYEEKLAALESKFNAMFVEQKQVIEKLSKSAPAPAKTKFSKPVVKEVKSVNNKMNVLDIVRASANN
jgi:hypothetical protein